MIDMKVYMQNRREKRRLYAIQKLGGKCVVCGSIENLEFDHKNRLNKKMGIASMFAHSFKQLDKELEKCQLLCRDCHIKKTFKDMGWRNAKTEHGTPRSYKYCRCELCTKVHREQMYAWRKKTGKH